MKTVITLLVAILINIITSTTATSQVASGVSNTFTINIPTFECNTEIVSSKSLLTKAENLLLSRHGDFDYMKQFSEAAETIMDSFHTKKPRRDLPAAEKKDLITAFMTVKDVLNQTKLSANQQEFFRTWGIEEAKVEVQSLLNKVTITENIEKTK
jgi:hypothetical protein